MDPTYQKPNSFPILVDRETSNLADSLLQLESEKVRKWYHDFIITLQLGQLMEPAGRNASELYDSLATIPRLQPLHREWQRKLGAALLDETQQALNAYLKTDIRELFRRDKYAAQYRMYPLYMERAIELMGQRNFMLNIMKTKLNYFQGLQYRLDASNKGQVDQQLLHAALQAQEQALTLEPEAAFVLNEIGVIKDLMGSGEAEEYFLKALALSPTWSIPYLNLSIVYQKANDIQRALPYAQKSVRLNEKNVIAINQLGVLYLATQQHDNAEVAFRQAIALDIKYEVSYYNLSCTKALQGNQEAALHWLEKSVMNGFKDWSKIEQDTDLAVLRNSKEYIALKNKYMEE